MTHGEAIVYLHSLSQFGFQPGLKTTLDLAACVGNPHERLRFIHVAGTNGKGSTCAMLEAVYRAAGLKVGLYTSPHLVRFNERIQVNRSPIPDDALAELTGILAAQVERGGVKPTFFEFTTVLALMWFERQRCDLVVWETGLGGRLDSTNIVTPVASIITGIGYDHMQILGDTIEAIAAEKAGIIKPGVPVVTADRPPEAFAVIKARSHAVNAPLRIVDASEVEHFPYSLSLMGRHQKWNAALAVAAVECLQLTLPVPENGIRLGLANTIWPGRMQTIRKGSRTIVLDGAHNLDGIQALKAALTDAFPKTKAAVIIGVLADKQWRSMAERIAGIASRVWVVPIESSRALAPGDLAKVFRAVRPGLQVAISASLNSALQASADESLTVIAGSLYLIGEAIELLLPISAGNERGLNEWGGPTFTAGTRRSI